jgi:hypothetical protein
MNEIYIAIDGEPVPAKDVVWLSLAPCGDIEGVSSINRHGLGEIYTNGSDAFHTETPKVVVNWLHKLGYTYQAITWQQYRDTYAARLGQCSHSPRWGIDPIPVPAGYVWMTADGTIVGRRTHRKHLVIPTQEKPGRRHRTATLCGQGGAFTDSSHELYDTIPCARCEKRARQTSPVLVAVSA